MEDKFRELIEAKGQTDGIYLCAYPAKDCRCCRGNEYYDILMAILDNENRIELLCSNSDGDKDVYFNFLDEYPLGTQIYIFNCFK